MSELTGPVSYAFAENFKFVTGTSPRGDHIAQFVVKIANSWSKERLFLLIKAVFCIVFNNNPILQYILNDHPLPRT